MMGAAQGRLMRNRIRALLNTRKPCGCTINRISRWPSDINPRCENHGYFLFLEERYRR